MYIVFADDFLASRIIILFALLPFTPVRIQNHFNLAFVLLLTLQSEAIHDFKSQPVKSTECSPFAFLNINCCIFSALKMFILRLPYTFRGVSRSSDVARPV